MFVIGKSDKVCTRNQDMHIYSCIYTCAWTFYVRKDTHKIVKLMWQLIKEAKVLLNVLNYAWKIV